MFVCPQLGRAGCLERRTEADRLSKHLLGQYRYVHIPVHMNVIRNGAYVRQNPYMYLIE